MDEATTDGSARRAGWVFSAAATHPGTRRTSNEDAWLNRPDLGLWAVADGAGGHAHGDVAARSVIATLDAIPEGLTAAEMLAQVRLRLEGVHRGLLEEASRRGDAVMASTIVVLLVRDDHFACLWAGDSRAYRLHDRVLEQLTVDHSLVQALVDQGAIDPKEAEGHAQANVITRAIGAGAVDLVLDKRIGAIAPGDRFLLCSDGLCKTLTAGEMVGFLGEGAGVEQIVAAALERHAADNTTVAVIDFMGQAEM